MPGDNARRKLSLLTSALLCLGILPVGPKNAAQDRKPPLWWELRVQLEAEGEYRTREDETDFSGDYQLTVVWTGMMERDAGDYRLFHGRSETTRWKAQETANSPFSVRVLTSDEFRDIPRFNMEYVLKEDDRLHFAFLVEGFYAPRAASAQKNFIALPVTEECSGSLPEPDYGSFVVRGSNNVSFDEKEIYQKTVDKEFAWIWKRQEWRLRERETSLFFARHNVGVHVFIKPHYEQ